MLDETHFHAIAGATLEHIHDQLEQAYDDGTLDDLDYDEGAGILTIITPQGQHFLVTKHAPSGQLWLASPLSGGLHFDYDHDAQAWLLADKQRLNDVLAANLEQACGLHVVL
jgi:iron donor protein CyaY